MLGWKYHAELTILTAFKFHLLYFKHLPCYEGLKQWKAKSQYLHAYFTIKQILPFDFAEQYIYYHQDLCGNS